MPETCGCKISAGYQIVGTENPRHVPPHIYEFCPLHARAADMRELLKRWVGNPDWLDTDLSLPKDTMALLEETR